MREKAQAASELADRQRAERVRLEMERLKRVRADKEKREKTRGDYVRRAPPYSHWPCARPFFKSLL